MLGFHVLSISRTTLERSPLLAHSIGPPLECIVADKSSMTNSEAFDIWTSSTRSNVRFFSSPVHQVERADLFANKKGNLSY